MEQKFRTTESETFSQEDFTQEAEIRFDPQTVRESNQQYKNWSKEKIAEIQKEGAEILAKMSEMMHKPVTDAEIQALVRDYHSYMEHYYHVKREIFDGLAELYMIDERFTAFFEKIKAGLADYLSQAMHHYCNTEFKELTQHS